MKLNFKNLHKYQARNTLVFSIVFPIAILVVCFPSYTIIVHDNGWSKDIPLTIMVFANIGSMLLLWKSWIEYKNWKKSN